MADKTIEEERIARHELELVIYNAIKKYEDEFNISVIDIHIKTQEIIGMAAFVRSVGVEVKY